jgi:hypothetical protein
MKTPLSKLIPGSLFAGVLLAFTLASRPDAQAVFSVNSVGYVNYTFQPGANLFGNPLDATVNDLNTLFPTAPDGTSVRLWHPATQQYLSPSFFVGGAWTMNLALLPGTGALLTTPSLFTNTFVGTVLNADGSAYTGGAIIPPPAFGGPNGLHLLSSKIPLALPASPYEAFNLIIGRAPQAGESVARLDAATQTFFTTSFDGLNWDSGVPGLNVGEAAFFTIVPEPGTFALGLCGGVLGVLAAWHGRRAKAVTGAKN